MPATRYRVTSSHPETISTGASFAPGELAVGVDPSDAHDKAAIDEGRLTPLKPKPAAKKEEAK